MPCIPTYEELQVMSAESGISLSRTALDGLVPKILEFLPELESLLTANPELAMRDGARHCLVTLRRFASGEHVTYQVAGRDVFEEESRLRTLAALAEEQLCVGGTLAWEAAKKSPDAVTALHRAFLKLHEDHREEDRRAKLRELTARLAEARRSAEEDAPRIQEALRALAVTEASGEDVGARRSALQAELEASPALWARVTSALQLEIDALAALSVDTLCSDRGSLSSPQARAGGETG